jgi:hypothetical protein
MNITEIGIVATFVVLVSLLGVFIISARFPSRRPMVSPDQAAFLMDQLVAEKNASKAALVELADQRVENGKLRNEVEALRAEVATLRGQIENLWSMMRGQSVAQSSTEAATRPPQNGNRSRAPFGMTDGDLSLRDWIVGHFDDGDLAVLAANAGMERPVPAKLAEMVTALVMAARRTGNLERLEREALEMRPDVEGPK